MNVKTIVERYKSLVIIAVVIVAIVLSWSIIKSFSEDASSSAWNGVVSEEFISGTGTSNNPYIIANGGDFAYFKELLEGEEALLYANKYYLLTNSLNYGGYDISINNTIPFSGVLDGNGYSIYNADITNSLFTSLDGATIKNISFDDIDYTLNSEGSGLLAGSINDATIDMLLVSSNISVNSLSPFGGLAYASKDSNYSNIVLDYSISGNSDKIYTILYDSDNDTGNNILVKNSNYEYSNSEIDFNIDEFNITGGNINFESNIDNYANSEYRITINNNRFVMEKNNIVRGSANGSKSGTRSAVLSDTITIHATGADGNTYYINDLTADYNYLKGLNFAEVRNQYIPSGTSTGYYDDDYLVKVEIIYDGMDINNNSLVGALSPINNENTNKFVYFKYYPLERDTNGSLATNSDGDNYIRIELIDNPFSKRPYVSSTEYGFNGWLCNQDDDTTSNLCENAVISLNKTNYTRYMEIPVTGGSELIVHLNANWYKAHVVTSANNISNFNSMSMQPTFSTTNATVTHRANAYWKQNYTQMVYTRSYVYNDGYLPVGIWYRTNRNSGTYNYVSEPNTVRANRFMYNTTYYAFEANTSGIVGGTQYTGGSYTFVANFDDDGSNTDTTINNYNATYMNFIDDPNGTYSYNERVTLYNSSFSDGDNTSGYYYKVSNPNSTMISTKEYYDANGALCTSTSACTTAYKLIQYNDSLTNDNGNSIYLAETDNNRIVNAGNYYYLVTRDLNIFRYAYTGNNGNNNNNNGLTASSIAVNKPFTLTGTAINATSANGILNISNNLTVANDLVIENIRFYGPNTAGADNTELGNNSRTGSSIYANSHNLKIGRNITSSRNSTYLAANSIMGGTNGAGPTGTFKVIVESGFYYAYHSGLMSTGNSTYTVNQATVLGNDYDRATNTNNKFKLLIGVDGYAGAHHRAGSDSLFASFTTVKSGTLGYNSGGSANTDNTAGMYIGGRASTCVDSITGAKIEGGQINTVVGGYGYSGSNDTNSTYIGMSGGKVRSIYGGAGHSTTKGNRIINVTGGTVSYSILGGSDSYSSTATDDGVVQGSTLVYVGGNVLVGDGSTGELNGVESGSVFGAGGGNSNPAATSKGTVYNSHVIINGGTITTSVYGGGNFGSVGTQSYTSAFTVIDIYGGTINSVYGGSKSAGFSKSDYEATSTIGINVNGGTIGNLYGGSNSKGDIHGTINVNVMSGTITTNVYGGGQGSATFAATDVNVVVGTSSISGQPKINGNVYGGSALGTVNNTVTVGAANGNTTVTINNGIIVGSVFGGGQGSSNVTPYVMGDIDVIINGGDITNVFGGHDQAGTFSNLDRVYLNGGIVDNAFGGGNRSSVDVTNVYLSGATVTNIYGGSNTLGDVTTANVSLLSGTVGNAYGGNNEGGTCSVTSVLVEGTSSVSIAVYGGGNQVNTTSTNVSLVSAGATVPNVYGGGNRASATHTQINQSGATVTNIFGGSNATGTVSNSNITHTGGVTENIYGGNNAGGNTLTATIQFNGGTATTVYGGGNQANGTISYVNVTTGTIGTIFGGGNSAGLTTSSNVTVTGGNIGTVYGGSNTTGLVPQTNVLINSSTATITEVYGGGNRAQVNYTSVILNSGTVGTIYGGGNLATVNNDTVVDINGGTISGNLYGGGNYGVVTGSSYVTITDATILGSAYAGGNGESATLQGDTHITVDGTTTIGTSSSVPPATGSVFGGGNQAYTGLQANNNSTSNVNIVSGTIYGNVYGGANTSVIYGSTIVNIGASALTGNLSAGDLYIKGHVFGGGEANASGSEIYDWFFISVTEGTNINVDGTGYNGTFTIGGSFYGGGNASSASGDSYLYINHYGANNAPKENISIQRVTYVTINNSHILLKGAIDRANEYDRELFSISRVEDFKLKDNSSLYLETGANLLEKFQSLDSAGNPATVTITENSNTITKSVDNRVYMFEGKNLNIAKDQQVTDYGEVIGMTFFGMFNYANGGNINTGIYSDIYDPGDILPWAGTFSRGSYVLGLHATNHNIKLNGFYSHFINETTAVNEVKYIEPTPTDARFYMWFIGENVIEYNVNLVASKYSTLGSVEASFLEFSRPNTSFQVLSFDSSEIASGVTLIDKDQIPRIAANATDANNVFGLSMEASNSGWLTTGKTSFYTGTPTMSGVTYYEGENSTVVPTMLFYLYHSKNLSEEKDLGTVRISVMAITKINALSNEIDRLVINVNMSSALFQTTEYEGSMTPGAKYELFASTSNNVTTKSTISAYYALYGSNTNLYRTGYYRALSSSFVLPEGTKITMLDFVNGVPEYYYHVIDTTDVSVAEAEFQLEGECSYPLSMFTRMGSKSNAGNYDDALKNTVYYDGTNSSEEFIFIVDFSDTEIEDDQLGNTLLIEIRDSNDETIITVLGVQHSQLTYNLYADMDSEIELSVTPSDDPLYVGYTDIFDMVIGYENSSLSGTLITDTQYFDSKLGVQIYIENSAGNVVSGTDLTGTYFTMDGQIYYPDIAGYTHIKLADKVGNTEKWIIFNAENSTLATGDYTFVMEVFASADGIYYSGGNSTIEEEEITIINSTFGLRPTLDTDSVIFSKDNDKRLNFVVDYTSLLTDPNIRIAMFRRKYDQIYDTNYEMVDFQDYVVTTMTETKSMEYMLTDHPFSSNRFSIELEDELVSGTYRLSFRLYDSNTMIGEVVRYIVIK